MAHHWTPVRRALAVQVIIQGGQYAFRPDRALASPPYKQLRPIGDTGWTIIGAAFIALGLIALATTFRPLPARSASFAILATLLTFEAFAALMNNLYLTATLVLPITVCALEVADAGTRRHARSLDRREPGCG